MTLPLGYGAVGRKGTVYLTHPYVPFPANINPNYEYSGTIPVGPLSQAWQGVQKINAVAGVGTLNAFYFYRVPSALRYSTSVINKNNPTGTYIGPGLITGPIRAREAMLPGSQAIMSNTRSTTKPTTKPKQTLAQRLLSRIT